MAQIPASILDYDALLESFQKTIVPFRNCPSSPLKLNKDGSFDYNTFSLLKTELSISQKKKRSYTKRVNKNSSETKEAQESGQKEKNVNMIRPSILLRKLKKREKSLSNNHIVIEVKSRIGRTPLKVHSNKIPNPESSPSTSTMMSAEVTQESQKATLKTPDINPIEYSDRTHSNSAEKIVEKSSEKIKQEHSQNRVKTRSSSIKLESGTNLLTHFEEKAQSPMLSQSQNHLYTEDNTIQFKVSNLEESTLFENLTISNIECFKPNLLEMGNKRAEGSNENIHNKLERSPVINLSLEDEEEEEENANTDTLLNLELNARIGSLTSKNLQKIRKRRLFNTIKRRNQYKPRGFLDLREARAYKLDIQQVEKKIDVNGIITGKLVITLPETEKYYTSIDKDSMISTSDNEMPKESHYSDTEPTKRGRSRRNVRLIEIIAPAERMAMIQYPKYANGIIDENPGKSDRQHRSQKYLDYSEFERTLPIKKIKKEELDSMDDLKIHQSTDQLKTKKGQRTGINSVKIEEARYFSSKELAVNKAHVDTDTSNKGQNMSIHAVNRLFLMDPLGLSFM